MKVCFYLNTHGLEKKIFSNPLLGNPGIGGTEFMFWTISFYLKKIYPEVGLLRDRSDQNADFPGDLLYHPRITSNFSRNPHDHDTHIRNAGHVLSGYDGKRIRHRRRLRYGRHPGDNCLFNRDAATGLLDSTIYIGAKKNERA